ncbi:MAG: tetratricopeptide repeat protein, partial [Fuerstiella sp.]
PVAASDAAELSAEADGYGGFGGGGFVYQRRFQQKADAQLIAAVRTQLDRQASQVAMLRDNAIQFRMTAGTEGAQQKVPVPTQPPHGAAAVLSDAELQRQQQVLDTVYTALQDIRRKYAETSTADQAGAEIFVIVNHWRAIAQWDRAAELARKFLTDNPTNLNLPKIRQEIARDWLAWASLGIRDPQLDREQLLTEISRRFDTAREELQAIIVGFPDETAVRHQAQWDIATSFLTQARVVTNSSPTLARGQFVRAGMELLRVAELFHDHPKIGTIPDMLWAISTELATRSYHDEAITIWNELQIHYPTHKIADESALRIAQTWQQLGQPLRAAEAFLELNFARGGSDVKLQDTIYKIAVDLKNEARWIESLHVLQTFVDSFPAHANAGQSLTMIGQIHQANEVWEDAIAAYRRVIDEFPTGAWTTEARWSIAECTINLSLWQEAAGAYAEFQQSYPKDKRVAEANRRIEVLKTLDRYQGVIDEEGQRKAFDAQFQVAVIVRTDLANTVKAIIEYRKVEKNWPNSHLADDALFEIGKIYLERGESGLARIALLQSAERYPKSPLADDALLLVGTSYVSEADQLAAVDRGKSQAIARDIAQRQAYHVAQDNRRRQSLKNLDQITALKVQGKREEAANKEAYFAGQALQFDAANTLNVSNWAAQQEEVLSAAQMADRQDKINAALRQAVSSFRRAASVTAADKADDALLQMAQIYDERLKDSVAAMSTWEEIVKQYSGTAVAEDASWKMAQYFENQQNHQRAIAAYQTFFRNYRRSPRAGQAQASIAENHEQLGEWVEAMDAYSNYVNNFPKGPLLKKAQDQINWIKTYRL